MSKSFYDKNNADFKKSDYFSVALTIRLIVLFVSIYTILVTSWLTDDAFISFRHIWNFVQGDGITFNFGERVQGFSHPLWFLLLSCITFFTNEILLTSLILSIILSLFSIIILMSIEIKNNGNITVFSPVLFLLFSYAYCDFTSSGLENPLAYFLIGLIFWFVSIKDASEYRQILFTLFALLFLTRFDFFILILPLTLYLAFSNISWNSKNITKLIIDAGPGFVIIFIWIVFSLIYFGFPLPNTYYAKLTADIPLEDYIIRGVYYILDFVYDPSSAVIIITSFIISIYSRNRIQIALTIGLLLYVCYIIYIGGDFMRGRFFSTIVYLSVGQFVLININSKLTKKFKRNSFIATLIVIVISGISDFRFPFTSTENYIGRLRFDTDAKLGVGIQDERGLFYNHFGLFSPNRKIPEVITQSNVRPDDYEIYCGHIGEISLFGKSILSKQSLNGNHLIDVCALTEPLLARIPAIENKFWRIGHNVRKIPTDYGELLIGNISELPDENIRGLANDVILATMGEIFTFERFKAIWRLNTGYYSSLNFDNYKDRLVWVPTTTKIRTVEIENWNDEIEVHYRPRLNYVSKTPMTANGLTLVANPTFIYEISINDEIIATNLVPGDRQELHVEFATPILVYSVQVRTLGLSNVINKWSIFTDWVRFQSLWPVN